MIVLLGVDPLGIDPLASEPGVIQRILEASLSFVGILSRKILYRLTASFFLGTTSILDTFNRASEALSNGGKWLLIGGLSFTGAIEAPAKDYTAKSEFPIENGAYWQELPTIGNPFLQAEMSTAISSSERYVVL